jgi:Fe-S cluster assembly protein SufD
MSKAPKIVTHRKRSRVQTGLSDFRFKSEQLPKPADERLMKYHQDAWETYHTLPFPTLRDEPWRRTDIRALRTEQFNLPGSFDGLPQPPARLLDPITTGSERAGQVVSGMTEHQRWLDDSLEAKGVVFMDFQSAEEQHPDLMNRLLGQIVTPAEDKFTALAAAMAQDGVVLYVPKNVVIDQPLHSLYWGSGQKTAFFNHLIVWLEEGAEVTFVHESASPEGDSEEQVLHDGIVEIHVGRNARLNFVELQSWGDNVWSFTRERAQVLAEASLEWIFGAMGTHLTKNFSDIDLVEPGSFGRMSGFYFTSGDQHLDHDTQQNHLATNTTSDLLYKGALMDHSRSVWQGMIYVAPGAIGTDGYQANRNLILSKGARADSIPGLEILADDVRCTHGATVGKIDESLLFYLESRGIPTKDAEELIVLGFFMPIMERIPFEGVRNRFTDAIQEKMANR